MGLQTRKGVRDTSTALREKCTVVQSAPSRYGAMPGNGEGLLASYPGGHWGGISNGKNH
jgi:hypothetical protein